MLIPVGRAFNDIVRSGLELWLDARDYVSGQTWEDRAGAYDFFLGADGSSGSDDPTYNAGPPPYFSFDGADFLTLAAAHAGTFMRKIGRQDQAFTLEAIVRRTGTANTDDPMFANGAANGGSDAIAWYLDKAGNKQAFYAEGTDQAASTTQVPIDAIRHVALFGKFDGSTTCGFTLQGVADGTFTFDHSGWTSGDSAAIPWFGNHNGGGFLQAGTRLYTARAYSRILTVAELLKNWNAEKSRFGF